MSHFRRFVEETLMFQTSENSVSCYSRFCHDTLSLCSVRGKISQSWYCFQSFSWIMPIESPKQKFLLKTVQQETFLDGRSGILPIYIDATWVPNL